MHPAYRPEIDGLRAIAVVLVVAYHAFPSLFPGGYIGVDVFFVISGYLITGILVRSFAEDRHPVLEFYSRRVRRIFPALITVLASCLAAGWVLSLLDDYAALGKHVAAGAGFVSNLVLWSESGYFDGSSESKPLLHLWSLGIEEQFYLLWPLALRVLHAHRRAPLATCVALILLSFAVSLHLTTADPVAAFYSPVTRFWELLVGAGLAIWQATPRAAGPAGPGAARWAEPAAWAGLACIVAAAVLLTPDRHFPGWWALLPTAGAALLIAAGGRAALNRQVIAQRAMVGIGLISYPLYLWHWPLLVFYRNSAESTSTAGTLAAVVASVLLAWATFRWIERPLRRVARPGRLALWLFAGCMAVGALGLVVYKLDGVGARAKVSANPRVNEQIGNASWEYSRNDICRQAHPTYAGLFCIQQQAGPPTLLLMGNSYANHLYPGLAGHPALRGHNILNIGTCDPSGVLGSDRSECPLQDAAITRNPTVKTVILNASWPTFDDAGLRVDTFTRQPLGPPNLPDYIAGLRVRIGFIAQAGARPILFLPKPEIPYNIRKCFGRLVGGASGPPVCQQERAVYEQQGAVIARALAQLAGEFPTLAVFDQAPLFCDATACRYLQDGLPLLRDNGHLSRFGSAQMADRFVQWARQAAPEVLREPPR